MYANSRISKFNAIFARQGPFLNRRRRPRFHLWELASLIASFVRRSFRRADFFLTIAIKGVEDENDDEHDWEC